MIHISDNAKDKIADAVCAAFLATGVCSLLYSMLYYEHEVLSDTVICIACTALIALLSLRWWIVPALLTVAGLGGTIVSLLQRAFMERLELLTGFIEWLAQGLPPHELYAYDFGIFVLKFTIAVAASVILFFLMRRMFSFVMIFGLSAAGTLTLYLSGFTGLLEGTAVLAAANIALLPRVFHKHMGKKTGGKLGVPRYAVHWLGLVMALAALVLTLLVIPNDTSAWRSREINNIVADIRDAVVKPERRPLNYFKFPFAERGRNTGILGGPVDFDSSIALIVTTDTKYPLRGSVYDNYTGFSWQRSRDDGQFRFNSLLWRERRDEVFITPKASSDEELALLASITTTLMMKVKMSSVYSCSYFTAGSVSRLMPTESTVINEPYFNMGSECFSLSELPPNTTYEFDAKVFDRKLPEFDDTIARLETLALTDPYWDDISARYLQMPDNLPSEVADAARAASAGAQTPYEAAVYIERWLARNCRYTLSPEPPPEGADFVAYFLSTREGYCTYYASAMTVMARAMGLPARYIVGFAMGEMYNSNHIYDLTNEQAHAWCEIYFKGIGWISFDPLGFAPDNDGGIRELPVVPEIERDEGADSGSSPELAEEAEPKDEDSFISYALIWILLIAILTLTIWFFTYMMRVLHKRRFMPERLARRYPAPEARLEVYVDDIFAQLKLLGLNLEQGETLSRFAARTDSSIEIETSSMEQVGLIAERWYYGSIRPDENEIESVHVYHTELERELISVLDKRAYFRRRVMTSWIKNKFC